MADTSVVESKRPCVMKHGNDDSDGKPQNDDERKGSAEILNDFCLLQILDKLDMKELCNVVNLNKQFKRVSMMSFSMRYKTFCYPYDLKMYSAQLKSEMSSQMRRVLCNFGQLIKSLQLIDFQPAGVFSSFQSYPIEMDAISKYCAGTLDELKLNIFLRFDCDLAKPLFASLKTLKISCSGFDGDASQLFKVCEELKILKVNSVPYKEIASEIAQNYPSLEELIINSTGITSQTINSLLQLNPQIKKLDMLNYNVNTTICAVASKMIKLEELILRCELVDFENINELGKLKALKVLELHDMAFDFVPAINAMENVPLERLKWFGCPSNIEFMNSILKIKSLKSLALTGISSALYAVLTMLGERLPLLEELELGFNHEKNPIFSVGDLRNLIERVQNLNALVIHTNHSDLFNQKFYDSLLQAIRKRSNTKTFKFIINGRTSTSLQMDSRLLHVEFIWEHCGCRHCEPLDYLDWMEDDFDDYEVHFNDSEVDDDYY